MKTTNASMAEAAVLVIIVTAVLLPFVNKAIHIDDTVFLKTAEHLTRDPLHPFAATINWVGTSRSVFYEDNPFFLSYYLALIIKAFGEREWILHASYLVFPVVAVIGCYFLAAEAGFAPLISALLLFSAPAFFVSATTLMADVPLFAFYILSCCLYLRFQRQPSTWQGLALSLTICLAIFTKYIGLTLIPLLLIDAFYSKMWKRVLIWLLVPLIVFVGWCFQNWVSFGAIHILEAAKSMHTQPQAIVSKFISSISFTLIAVVGFGVVLIFRRQQTAGDGRRNFLFVVWLFGMVIYSWLSEYIAGRVVLLFACPFIILLMASAPRALSYAAIVLNLTLSLLVAQADSNYAMAYKRLAETAPLSGVHYIAHWGFQYYLEQRGMKPYDYERDHLNPGDVIIVPQNAGTSDYPVPRASGPFQNAILQLEKTEELSPHRGLFTMNFEKHAGFYCDAWGRFPFMIGKGPYERIYYFKVVR